MTKQSTPTLTPAQKIDLYYWMRLTRTFDEQVMAMWKQGRGVGGVFSQRGHEAISVGAAFALEPEDVIAPMHRDVGAYMLQGDDASPASSPTSGPKDRVLRTVWACTAWGT